MDEVKYTVSLVMMSMAIHKVPIRIDIWLVLNTNEGLWPSPRVDIYQSIQNV